MSWDYVIPQLIRGLINDMSPPYTYTDGRLQELTVLSAHLLLNEVTFSQTYTISLSDLTITPDPASDVGFVNLVALKASTIVLNSEVKAAANQSILIKDGPATIDLGNRYNNIKDLAKNMEKAFDQAKLEHQLGNQNPGRAVVGAIIHENVPPYMIS